MRKIRATALLSRKAGNSLREELLAFLDADGTCDPRFFADLANLMQKDNADVVLGSRLNKNSEMPRIRRFGNTLFSVFLSVGVQ